MNEIAKLQGIFGNLFWRIKFLCCEKNSLSFTTF